MTCLGSGWARAASLGMEKDPQDAALDPRIGAITEAAPNTRGDAARPGTSGSASGPSPSPQFGGGTGRSDSCA
jgi:hypothetical protein